MPEKLPPEIAFNRITQEPRVLGLAVSLLAQMPDTEKSISLLQTKMAERLTEAADSLSYDRETLLRRIQTLEREQDRLKNELAIANSQAINFGNVLRDLRDHGLRCDMNPTLRCPDVEQTYASWVTYLKTVEDSLKSRCERVLSDR